MYEATENNPANKEFINHTSCLGFFLFISHLMNIQRCKYYCRLLVCSVDSVKWSCKKRLKKKQQLANTHTSMRVQIVERAISTIQNIA